MYSFSDCLAHPPDDYLTAHLMSVARANKALWNNESGSVALAAIVAGLLHDIGKANRWFQDRVYGKTDSKTHYSDHSLPSAVLGWYVTSGVNFTGQELNRFRLSIFTAILRHHSNLEQPWEKEIELWKHRLNSSDKRAHVLFAQLYSMDLPGIESWFKRSLKELDLSYSVPELKTELIIKSVVEARPLRLANSFRNLDDLVGFLGVYSGLLHFDKIHSAAGTIDRKRFDLPDNAVKDYTDKYLSSPTSQLFHIRKDVAVLLENELAAHWDEHFFTVTAPTGSGKTLAILNAVLKLRNYLQEETGITSTIIYCLPFTSIIEQNHAVYRDVLETAGLKINSEILLKHHHLTDPAYLSSDPEFDPDDSELFTESWQSEIVVTTFHQLLNSIMALLQFPTVAIHERA